MCLTVKYLPASNQILYANKQKPPTSTPSCKQKTPLCVSYNTASNASRFFWRVASIIMKQSISHHKDAPPHVSNLPIPIPTESI